MNDLKLLLDFLEAYYKAIIELNIKGLESVKEHLELMK